MFHINLQKDCFGRQFDQFSAKPLNGPLDISASSWHNYSRVFEDSFYLYTLQGDVITISAVKHSLLGTTHTGIKYYITCGFVCSCSINCDISHVTKYPRLSSFLRIFVCMWESLGMRLTELVTSGFVYITGTHENGAVRSCWPCINKHPPQEHCPAFETKQRQQVCDLVSYLPCCFVWLFLHCENNQDSKSCRSLGFNI